ncbi:crossover junction endodeoxyribonuclease RuvC [Patescibacteria group bacterium]|nr:crossover junction endodeoxyribonuclease RuvC [Patescibacteria group bacterium]
MIILGLDPGFARVGYGIIKKQKGDLKVLTFGSISTPGKQDFCGRLLQISLDLEKLIKKYKPNHCAIEELFFFKNLKTAVAVASARGVLLVGAKKLKLDVFEYTPLQVKQAITGYGRADKTQIMRMVTNILKIKTKIKLDDVTDALAVAICHASSLHFLNRLSQKQLNPKN